MSETIRDLNEQFEDDPTRENQVVTGEPLAAQVGASAYNKEPSNQHLFDDPETTIDEAAQG